MSITAAGIVFSFLIATAYGSGFHLIVGGRARTIPVYLIASWIGFILGHLIGDYFGINAFRLGVIQLFSASLGSWIMLLVGRWIFGLEPQQDTAS